jgi:hypothetical protein
MRYLMTKLPSCPSEDKLFRGTENMNNIARKIVGAIVLIIGVGVILFGSYLLFTGGNISLFSLIPFVLGGIIISFAGWGIITGERIRDILDTIFTGMS